MSEATKTCTKCGVEYPATTEYFYHRPQGKTHLTSWCKRCYWNNYQRVKLPIPPASDGMRRCTKCLREFPETAEFFHHSQTGKNNLRSWCKECSTIYTSEYLSGNPTDKDAKSEYDRQHYLEHREEVKARAREYHQEHKEECNCKSRARHHARKEEANERTRQWFLDHPEAKNAYEMNRRARKRNNGGTHTGEDRLAQFDRQKGKCYYCSAKLGDDWQIDHVMPLSLGGSNGPENLVACCKKCNMSKKAKHPMDFAGILL